LDCEPVSEVTKRINSRQKGAAAEREFAKVLAERKLCARRGQQFSGGTDSPDVVCTSLTDIHFEVKRVEAGNLYIWLAQAIRDAGDKKVPIVAHRRNQQDWVAVLPMSDLLDLLILREGTLI
jgi:Holliday junction resolvase